MSEPLLDLSQFHETFFAEASEHVATLEATLLGIAPDADDREPIHQAFRAAHSIKGSAGIFGFAEVTRFTHAIEALLEPLRTGALPWSPEVGQTLLESVDVLRGLLSQPDAKLDETGETLRAALLSLARGESDAACPAPVSPAVADTRVDADEPLFDVRFVPSAEIFRRGTDPLLVLRDLGRASKIVERRVLAETLPDLEELDPSVCHVGWTFVLACEGGRAELDEVFEFVVGFGDITIQRRAASADGRAPTLTSAPTEGPPSAPTRMSIFPTGGFGPSALAGAALLHAAPPVITMPAVASSLPPPKGAASLGVASLAPRPPAGSLRPSAGVSADASTVRIATKKLDRILDLVGELVVSKSMITSALRKRAEEADLREALATLERHTRELQDSVMAVRMVPMSSVFNRFPRVVRELGTKLGKEVVLELQGTDTEIDRAMVEQLTDPLTHLVRNAVDHGLETGETRAAAGKPAAGHLVLSASHRGGAVVIEIRDDGKGLDLERVRAKAIERGLLAPTDQPTPEQLHMLVFEPGFSTASAVTDVSGRGVGMDVVKRNVEALGGAIQFTSELGRGSVVRLQLPLTMAIIDGLSLRVGSACFVVPLLSVVESLRPAASQLRTVLGKGRVMTFRGSPIPVVALADVLDVPSGAKDPTTSIVVVVEAGADTVGLVVDELLADGQVVVKSLEANYRRLEGLAGATVLGDGSIALILDVPALARLACQAASRPHAA